MSLNTPVDGAIGLQLASGYTAGSGSLVLKAGQGAKFVTFPTIVTVITNASYNTGASEVLCEFTVTGKSTDTLTGVAAVSGFTDQNFATNDYVEGRVSAKYVTDLNSVVSLITLGGAFTTSGAFTTTLTVTGNTAITLPTSGTLISSTVTTLSSLVSVGTISTGVWNGTPVDVVHGGTGNSSATAYAVLCGGTSNTGVVQSVASVGSAGQVLTSNGAAALPSFQAAGSGSGTVNTGTAPLFAYYATSTTAVSPVSNFGFDLTNTCPKWTAIADPGTPAAGDVWLSSTTGALTNCRATGFTVLSDGTFYRSGLCTALASSSSQTTLLISPANSWGSLTIPSGFLRAGQWIDIEFSGIYSTTGGPTLTWFLMFGGVVVCSSPAVAGGTNMANAWFGTGTSGHIIARTVGGSGTINGFCIPEASGNGGNFAWFMNTGGSSPAGGDITSFNYNQANALDLQFQWGTLSSSNTIQLYGFTARIRG